MDKRKRLTPEEKHERARQGMIETAKQYQIGTYMHRFVSKIFQRMIRAEAASLPDGTTLAIVKGELSTVLRRVGQCVCVTCGKVGPWSGGLGGMHTGHFLGSRRFSIVLEEDNVAPQCSRCNRFEGGAQRDFVSWMAAARGSATIERLKRLKATTRTFDREELVDLRLEFQSRLKAAEERMG